MPIKHSLTADGDPLVKDTDWNANHTITNLLGYELIEVKDLAAGSTTTTFSNLNGDEDFEYLIEGELDYVYSTSEGELLLKPNNITTNQYYSRIFWGHNAHGINEGTKLYLANNAGVTGTGFFKAILKAKTGRIRYLEGTFYVAHTNDQSRYLCSAGCHWNDTSTNITSLVITMSPGTMSGQIRLWKRISVS